MRSNKSKEIISGECKRLRDVALKLADKVTSLNPKVDYQEDVIKA